MRVWRAVNYWAKLIQLLKRALLNDDVDNESEDDGKDSNEDSTQSRSEEATPLEATATSPLFLIWIFP